MPGILTTLKSLASSAGIMDSTVSGAKQEDVSPSKQVPTSEIVAEYFDAVDHGNAEQVRSLLQQYKQLCSAKQKSDNWKWDNSYALDAYKFLGAYLGSMTGLQVAVLRGFEEIAADIIDATLNPDDLNIPFGSGNTALHLATFLGSKDVVKLLIQRGADKNIKNAKGFTAVDVMDDNPDMQEIYTNTH